MLQLILITFLIRNCWTLYPPNSNVVELTPENFDQLVINNDEVWMVEFYAPWCGHCQEFVPKYQKTADALKGVAKVGSVDANAHETLAQRFRIKVLPTVKIFGANKNTPDDYNGQRTAEGLTDMALSVIQNKVYAKLGISKASSSNPKAVIELTDSNFDEVVLDSDDIWLVEFYAPWCGHCKNLVPHWAQAATELQGKVKLGALDATVHTVKATKLGVQSYPTIKYYAAGKKSLNSAENYDGGRTSNDIVNWALVKFAENAPAPEITQILGEESFKEHCEEKTLCVISILPHILDCQSDCRREYLDMLQTLSEKYKRNKWGWTWSEAEAQPNLENALAMGGFGYPSMAVVNVRKMKYSMLRGSFSKEGINEFLRDLSYGRGNTAPVRGGVLPKILKVDAWDGQDGELPIEEEFDSSGEEVDEKEEL